MLRRNRGPREKIIIFLCLLFFLPGAQGAFLEEYPQLKQYLFVEPVSNFYFGMGAAPAGIMGSKVYLTMNLFQIHQLKRSLDWEVFSASVGTTLTEENYLTSDHFTFRTIPKYRFSDFFSLGPVFGVEFLRYSQISSRLYKNKYVTPYDVFTNYGLIYGIALSENFTSNSSKIIKVNQVVYQQTYSTDHNSFGWKYLYKNEELENKDNLKKMQASLVFLMEISVLL